MLQQPDDREHQPNDANVATRDERFAERRHDFQEIEPARDTGHEPRDRYHQQRVDPQNEPDDDNDDTD